MYTTSILLLAVCAFVCHGCALSEVKGLEKYGKYMEEQFNTHKDECFKESGASEDLFNKMKEEKKYIPSKELHCFTGCFWTKLGLLNDDFTLNEEKGKEISSLIENDSFKEIASKAGEEIKSELAKLETKDKCAAGEKIDGVSAKFMPNKM